MKKISIFLSTIALILFTAMGLYQDVFAFDPEVDNPKELLYQERIIEFEIESMGGLGTGLAGQTWQFKSSIDDVWLYSQYYFEINFISNGETYNSFDIVDDGGIIMIIRYSNVWDDYAYSSGWTNTNYRTVKFLSGSDIANEDFIEYVMNNATFISSDPVGEPEVTDGTYEKLIEYMDLVEPDELTGVYPAKIYINDELYDENGYITYNELYGPYYVIIYSIDTASDRLMQISVTDEFMENYPATTNFEVGDKITLILEPLNLDWNSSNAKGQIYYEDDYWHLKENIVSGSIRIYINDRETPSTTFQNYGLFTQSSVTADSEVIVQSRYKNFRIQTFDNTTVLLDVEDVYLVYIKLSDNLEHEVYVYFFDELGEIDFETYTWNGSSLIVGYFYGVYREAINLSDELEFNVNDAVDLESILEELETYSYFDGYDEITAYIEEDDGFDGSVIGEYEVEFAVTDSLGITEYKLVTITVYDDEAPEIAGDNEVVTSYHVVFDVDAWLDSLVVTDNYDNDLEAVIHTNTYTANKTKIGTYSIVVKSTDSSGNVGTFTLSIEVVDGKAPEMFGFETIKTAEPITAEQIKNAFIAIDEVEGNVTSSITIDEDTLTGALIPGTYTVVLLAEDSSGNVMDFTILITLIDEPLGFYLVDDELRILPGAELTLEVVKEILEIPEETEVSTNYDPETNGLYNLTYEDGEETIEYKIRVLGQSDPILPIPVIPGNPSPEFDLSQYTLWIILGVAAVVIGFVLIKRK